ncbi:MAG TPA: tetratricopeptide repeat protein, partial [Candidatus Acidoferrum sp.]|nr:tetratricopeptide repeat protein [Candidatus Acidoferrum sp.]
QGALRQKIGWIPAKSNLARVYQEILGEPETAEKLFREVIEVRPDDAYAHYMLGRNYDSRKDEERAMQCYEKALGFPFANLRLGQYHEKKQDPTTALSYYHKAEKLPEAKEAIARLQSK